MEKSFRKYENFTIIFDFVAQQIFFYLKRQKKNPFLHKSRQIGYFSEGEAPQLIQKSSKKSNFFLLKFSPALKVGKIKYGLYITETFCSTSRKTKKKNVSPYFAPWLFNVFFLHGYTAILGAPCKEPCKALFSF